MSCNPRLPSCSEPSRGHDSWFLLLFSRRCHGPVTGPFLRRCSFPGLQQQGIFRVPGSQVEVNDIKNSFERGAWPREAAGGLIRRGVDPALRALLL